MRVHVFPDCADLISSAGTRPSCVYKAVLPPPLVNGLRCTADWTLFEGGEVYHFSFRLPKRVARSDRVTRGGLRS